MKRFGLKKFAGQMFFAGCLSLCVSAPAMAVPGRFTVYSNVCQHNETGDLLGTRIIIMDLGRDDIYVLYAEAQGGAGFPSAHWLDPDQYQKFRGGQLEFEDNYLGPTTVKGTITADAIILTEGGFSNDDKHPIRLPKRTLPERWLACK